MFLRPHATGGRALEVRVLGVATQRKPGSLWASKIEELGRQGGGLPYQEREHSRGAETGIAPCR